MFLIDFADVRTMRHVKARAEASAWVTYQAYLDAARHAHGLTRSDRAENLLKAREYKRRAIRVSHYLNAH